MAESEQIFMLFPNLAFFLLGWWPSYYVFISQDTSKLINPLMDIALALIPNCLCASNKMFQLSKGMIKGSFYCINFVAETFLIFHTPVFCHHMFISHNTIYFNIPTCSFETAMWYRHDKIQIQG